MQNSRRSEHKILLKTKEDFKIYLNPARQQLLRELEIAGHPMTPKALSEKLSISASSVQYHLTKLQKLGVVEVSHTGLINGITATYYAPTFATVQICAAGGLPNEKQALLLQLVNNVVTGFMRLMERRDKQGLPPERLRESGDILTGVAYLNDEERAELFSVMDSYIKQHERPKENADAWEYAVVLYNTNEEK